MGCIGMKVKRNTARATQMASEQKREKRLRLQKYVAEHVIPDFCRNEDCPGALRCGRDVFRDCVSYNDLAGTLNVLCVHTLSGKMGNWKAQMVKNLFKDLIKG